MRYTPWNIQIHQEIYNLNVIKTGCTSTDRGKRGHNPCCSAWMANGVRICNDSSKGMEDVNQKLYRSQEYWFDTISRQIFKKQQWLRTEQDTNRWFKSGSQIKMAVKCYFFWSVSGMIISSFMSFRTARFLIWIYARLWVDIQGHNILLA